MIAYDALCRLIGDPHISGNGVEIGAGTRPIYHKNVAKMYFYDKRNEEEFAESFGQKPDYPLSSWDVIDRENPDGVDFLCHHHVIEHVDNPIDVLLDWLSHLKEGGVMFMSLPSNRNVTEHKRLPTPLSHILEDYFFERPAGSFESKQHIYPFITAMAAHGGEMMPWFAHEGATKFAEVLMWDTERRDDHDLHWHTYDMKTIISVAEIAFHLAGSTATLLQEQETDDSLFLVMRRDPLTGSNRDLAEFSGRIHDLARRLETIT